MNSAIINICDEIRRAGPLTFARFMELALYAPGCGYYERKPAVGRSGDFFTSVSVGPVFGELLAFQFAQWLAQIEPPSPPAKFQIIEAGAHNGQLALDVLTWLRQWRPQLDFNYCLIEPSHARRSWQEETLGHQFPNVQWLGDVSQLEPQSVRGIIFSNELLDAMPAHRLCWNAASQKWRESFVDFQHDNFVWQSAAPSSESAGHVPVVPAELAAVIPDGYAVEISPAALQWWSRAAQSLHTGKLLTLDYGLDDAEWLRPERAHGTLRAYRDHRLSENIVANPGEQDITAHVNFPAVRGAGERVGLRTELLVRQSVFLTEILQRSRAPGSGLEDLAPARTRQFQTLTHPEQLGHRFRALLQCR